MHIVFMYSSNCCNLSQDMVVEFARMDAASLLEETEKAVSPLSLSVTVCV